MTDEIDPEVQADLDLRERTMHDRSRTRAAGVYNHTPDKLVGAWKCRNPHCQVLVGVTEDGIGRWAMFNRELMRRREAPLDRDQILLCADCRTLAATARRTVLEARVKREQELMRELVASEEPTQEREILKQLEAWHHPDIPGLLKALEEKLKAKRKGSSRKWEV